MLDYALIRLFDGRSIPGVILVLLFLAFLYWLFTDRRIIFASLCSFFFLMSIPLTGKILLYPLESGLSFAQAEKKLLAEPVEAVAVISSGWYRDRVTGDVVPTEGTYSRLKRGEKLASLLEVPLLISGATKPGWASAKDYTLVSYLKENTKYVFSDGAAGTVDHVKSVVTLADKVGAKKVAVFVSGIHTYRTVVSFKKYDIDIPVVVVGKVNSVFRLKDLLPNFIGFFYWKHAIKEYVGIAYYLYQREISLSDLF